MSDPSAGGGARAVDLGSALRWSWMAFRTNAGAFMGLSIIVVVLTAAQQIGTTPIQNVLIDCVNPQSPGQENACSAALTPSALAPVLGSVGLVFLALVAQVGVQRAALGRTRGVQPSVTDLLESRNLGRYAVYVIVYRILFFVGIVLCILPGLLVLMFLQFGQYFILDRGMGVVEAMKASAALASRNLGPVAGVALIAGVLELAGGLLFGLPILLTLPLASLFVAHVYRQLTHEPVV